ncbi:ABC transporter substrate-binding protein [Sphingomonas hankookensis]|uniref:Iron ABC transporter substrate-binding protein n=1 Tax=Sphingomonas hengshuiensis TaxID=1609977 RepID=A0A2W5BCM9_9SPHN|nr:MAG: iron ABC transporter substrate-binding protein [Sphingomonas hengshuiensis]
MTMPNRRTVLAALAAVPLAGCGGGEGEPVWRETYPGERRLFHAAREQGIVASFDTGPNWAGWGGLFAGFERRYPGVRVGYNDTGSGPGVILLERTRAAPQGDSFYAGAGSGIDAAARDLFEPFVPHGARGLPPSLRAADHGWHVVHGLDLAFLANRRLVARCPARFADLADPLYRDAIVHLDPRTTAQGQAVFLAANRAAGGSDRNLAPGARFFDRLDAAGTILRVSGGTPYAQFIKGEVPVWIGYAADGVRAHRDDGLGGIVALRRPADAPLCVPYVIGLVRGAPHQAAAMLWLHYIFSAEGQALFARAGARPVAALRTAGDLLPVGVAADTRAAVAALWNERMTRG